MNDQEQSKTFGEKLMGMEGFSAARAQRYRAELEKLLVHRITTKQRWIVGIMGIYMLASCELVAISCALKWDRPNFPITSETRLTIAISFMVLGLLFCGWFLRIALQGGHSRRLGDLMGVAIVLVFGGSAASLFYSSAWTVDDVVSRDQMLFGAGIAVACTIGCIILASIQVLYRRTNEKLLRIEYQVAELIERSSGTTST